MSGKFRSSAKENFLIFPTVANYFSTKNISKLPSLTKSKKSIYISSLLTTSLREMINNLYNDI
jgi:hypothetical protein